MNLHHAAKSSSSASVPAGLRFAIAATNNARVVPEPQTRVRPPAIERRLSVARRSANSMSMKPRHAATLAPRKCARCGNPGKHRWIDDFFRFRITKIGVFLCDKCYAALRQADARAWEWFREYRDRI